MARIPNYVNVITHDSGKVSYEIRVEVGIRGGPRKQKTRRVSRLADAIAEYNSSRADRARGTQISPNDLTVEQAVEQWLDGQRIRTKTMSAYVTSLRPLVDHLGNRAVQSITKQDIEAVVKALRDGKSKMGTWRAPTKIAGKQIRSPWKATSINPMLARTRNVMQDLVDQGVLVRNPATLVKALPTTKPKLATQNADEVRVLLDSTESHPLGIAVQLAVHGLRRGEICALRWDGIDFDAETLTIDTARLAVGGGSETGAPKTKSSERTLPLPPDLLIALRRELARQESVSERLGSKWPNSGMVVVGALGAPPHPDTLTHAWADALASADLPHVRLHDARHGCATLMHLNGVPAVVIAAWLGHTDARFTLATYAHSTNEALTDAGATFGAVLTGGREAG